LHGRAAIRVGIAAVAALLMLPAAASADTVTVNTVADHNDKVCDATDCTLREAVELGTNTINLPKGHYTLSAALGELVLVNDHIVGAGARAAIIDGANETRVLRAGDGTSSIEGVTVTGGNGVSSVSSGAGGGIYVPTGATLNITASAIDGNTAGNGGGIDVLGGMIIDTSTVSGNTAEGRLPLGAGILSTGSLVLRNSTVSGNTGSGSTSQGGGIASGGGLGLNGVTISNNTANAAAGLLESIPAGAAPPARILFNTIIGGNNGPECAGTGLDTDTTRNSIADDTTCALADATDQQGVNPQLRALANYGGQTDTHALISTSPAVNKGASCFGAIDQRGVTRPQAGTACDVGAFEYRPHALNVITTIVNNSGGTLTAGQVQVHVRVDGADTSGSPAAGVGGAGRAYSLLTGNAYVVEANAVAGYALSYSSGCSAPIAEGGANTCTVTADDAAPTLKVITTVRNDNGGTKQPGDFSAHVRQGGADAPNSPQPGTAAGTTYTLSAGSYAVAADGVTGYASSIAGDCAADGSVTLQLGQAKTCTITEDDVAATVTTSGIQSLPPPVIHKSVNLLPSQGKVLIKIPGSKDFEAIEEGQQVPLGTVVDVRKGRVTLIAAADAKGNTANAVFYGGIFKLGQTKSKTPTTVLSLVEKLTGCKAKGKATIAKKKVKKRRLWGDGKGHFQTKGKHSAATVVGTKWLVQDSCSSTLTKVARGIVSVRDFAKKKTVKVKAGHKYVARAR
jgi:CSLREA domain-containing protein